jgi:LacI family transcriptional regulator
LKPNAIYRLLVESLKKDIQEGRYGAGNPLPSVRALIRRTGLSNTTVLHALDELAHQGLISRRQGSGTFVKKRNASRKIGLIVPGVAVTDFFKPVVSEINNLARNAGYDLRFREVWSEVREERIKQVREFAAEFIKGNFAGVIYEPLAGPIGDEINPHILSLFDRKKIPVVLLDCDIVPFPERSRYDVVGVNDLEAGARIVKHLMSVGAKRIHFLICSLCPTTFSNRLAGAESQLKLAGAKMPNGGNVLFAEADDVNALKRYLKKQTRRPDAFICSNDAIAAVFKQTLEKAGLRVPDDVMLTGFADLSIASLMTPRLTTIRQDREQMAQAAFRRLLERIAEPSLPSCDIFLPAQLVTRESTERNVKRRT